MDEVECPNCKTTKYRNPNLKLMVNFCGHALCVDCVEMLFVKGSGACPQCNIALRRGNFRVQVFEDSSVEKELDIRRKILRDFNKKEDDFSSLREYNDYLEEIENIIFNLANNIDVDSTKRRIDQYKKENKTQIIKNRGRRSKEEEALDELIENERIEKESTRQQVAQEEKEVKKFRIMKNEALVDDLMFSDLPVQDIMASHSEKEEENVKQPPKKRGALSRENANQTRVFKPIPDRNAQLYVYSPLKMDSCGPQIFTPNTIKTNGFLQHVRSPDEVDIACGFLSDYACHRALDDAFNGLYFVANAVAHSFNE